MRFIRFRKYLANKLMPEYSKELKQAELQLQSVRAELKISNKMLMYTEELLADETARHTEAMAFMQARVEKYEDIINKQLGGFTQ